MLSALKFLSNAACFAGPPSLASVLAVTVLLKPVPLKKASQRHIKYLKTWRHLNTALI